MIVARERLIIPTIVDSSSVLGSLIWPVVVRLGSNAMGYALHRSRSRPAVIRVYDAAGNVIESHEHGGDRTVNKPWHLVIVGFSPKSHARQAVVRTYRSTHDLALVLA